MRVSYNWLREFLKAEVSPEDLSKHLLMLGFEVAELTRTGPAFSGVIVAEILEIQKHPNADRLSLCSVTTGAEKLSIVCGAKNIAVGQRVPLAVIGAKLPGGRTIERSKIRGVESQGMLCSSTELGLSGNGDGIKVLPSDTPLGQDAGSLFGESDAILEVDITSNRPDCLSHYGLARELGIYFRRPVSPFAAPAAPAAGGTCPIHIAIEDAGACGRYIGRYFEGVKVGPSPAWMAQRLEALGLRPINALVDITNYVLLEFGHPLHVFDADKLRGRRLIVRRAKDGEKLKALDGKDYVLSAEDVVIADAERPVAIAGVMGGEETGVTAATTRALLEAAQFSAGRVRRTSQRLRLRSDSSYRFERGLAAQTAALASARAAQLIRESSLGAIESPAVDVYPQPVEPSPIVVSVERLNQVLGAKHEAAKVEGVLRDMAERLTASGEKLSVLPPAHRLDLKTVWDVAEEIGRHLGYEGSSAEPAPVRLQRPKSLPLADLSTELRRRLASLGFYEAYNYDFLSREELRRSGLDASKAVEVLNPLSEDWAYLRPTLVVGLLKAAAHNFRRGARGVRLFELGRVYHQDGKEGHEVAERTVLAGVLGGTLPERPDWTERRERTEPNRHVFEAKGAASELLAGYDGVEWKDAPADPLLHPQGSVSAYLPSREVCRVGLLHPSVAQAWDIPPGAAAFVLELETLSLAQRTAARLRPVSPFPSVVRDLSFTVPEGTRYADVEACLRGLPALARLDLLDRLTGAGASAVGIPAGRASLTLRLTFGLPDRTLKDDEVNAAAQKGIAELGARCSAVLRG
ncbi:MAG: phenylalanine--tRNA ligase subunit beta [Elusimicrobia bacterium]|nr:phenylalanine--tRNA ligase subunit beta [Elusimicrobiota bacterium]